MLSIWRKVPNNGLRIAGCWCRPIEWSSRWLVFVVNYNKSSSWESKEKDAQKLGDFLQFQRADPSWLRGTNHQVDKQRQWCPWWKHIDDCNKNVTQWKVRLEGTNIWNSSVCNTSSVSRHLHADNINWRSSEPSPGKLVIACSKIRYCQRVHIGETKEREEISPSQWEQQAKSSWDYVAIIGKGALVCTGTPRPARQEMRHHGKCQPIFPE